jgi:hypothetical protein
VERNKYGDQPELMMLQNAVYAWLSLKLIQLKADEEAFEQGWKWVISFIEVVKRVDINDTQWPAMVDFAKKGAKHMNDDIESYFSADETQEDRYSWLREKAAQWINGFATLLDLMSSYGFPDYKVAKKQLIKDISVLRSCKMYDAACSSSKVGVWKIGDNHVQDMITNAKDVDKTNVTLTTEGDFNASYDYWRDNQWEQLVQSNLAELKRSSKPYPLAQVRKLQFTFD